MVNCTERRIVFGLNHGRAAIGPQEARQNLLYLAIGSNLAYTFSNLKDYDIHVETSSDSNRTCRSSLVRLSGTRAGKITAPAQGYGHGSPLPII